MIPAEKLAEARARHERDEELYCHAAIPDEGHVRAHQDRGALLDEIAELQAEVKRAVDKERDRCAEIVQAARNDEIDRDFRTIIYFINGGLTVEEIAS